MHKERWDILISIGMFFLSVLFFAALVSYDSNDIPFETTSVNPAPHNYVGLFGAYLSWGIFKIFGLSGFLIPFLILIWAVGKFSGTLKQGFLIKLAGICLLFIFTSSFFSIISLSDPIARLSRGGLLGLFISNFFLRYFGRIGALLISFALSILALLVSTDFLIIPLVWVPMSRIIGFFRTKAEAKKKKTRMIKEVEKEVERIEKVERPPIQKKELPKIRVKPAVRVEKKPVPRVSGDYKLPGFDLLSSPPPVEERRIKEDLEENSRILEETLRDFGIETKVTDVIKGPVITRYELQPAPGVKVHRITNLGDDIALVMKAPSVRIVAPVPGKGCVGIEVPNSSSALVYLKEVLESPEFQNSDSKLILALGKDISGTPVIADLGDMPHLLIAGTTGSGKTVCVNSLVTSILFNATPDEVKFLMVDPKMVELAIFNGLPHLLCPVVTEAKKVSGALAWVVNEMEERYKLFAKAGTRNIEIFNEKSKDEPLPYIIIIIDELADLMMVAQADIENAITRLAQLSRAVGIHIVLATQRPSVDVVTGVIKANFPARISFKVASKVDSRTVLDMNGADKLLGKGDMLFLQPGHEKPIRAQGTLVTDPEIEKVVQFIKAQREPEYDDEILKEQERRSYRGTLDKDEFFDEAVKMVLETGQASVSMLQRRLRLGYTRAARLIDTMEEEGIIGPFRGSKPREILIKEYGGQDERREDEGDTGPEA